MKEGESIKKGQRIATMGEGPERKPRLHFEIRRDGRPVNPLLYLFGYRIYSAQSGGSTFYLVAKSDVSAWTAPRRCVRIGSSVLVERHN